MRLGGIIQLNFGGQVLLCKGEFTYNLGAPKKEPIMGANGKMLGHKEEGQPGWIKGKIQDKPDLDMKAILSMEGVSAQLELANGKVVVLKDAFQGGPGDMGTGEGDGEIEIYGEAEEVT